jgi:tRNA dimethylallyltransferase
VVVVCGPTAAGKTTAGIELCEMAGGEIVSADSVQVYEELDIGSAKPTPAERARVTHHMLDVVRPDEPMTAAIYADLARRAISDIIDRKKQVVVVGGTGLYIRALIHGLMDAPAAQPSLRKKLRAAEARLGKGTLHRRLRRVDPDTASRLHPSDLVRIIRALEVEAVTGHPVSELHQRHAFREKIYDVKYIGLDPGRDALARRIELRAAKMFDQGLVREAEGLLRRGYSPAARPLRSPGYLQAFKVLFGEMTREEAMESVCTAHRRYARRQRVWFRKVEPIEWYESPAAIPKRELSEWLRAGPCGG